MSNSNIVDQPNRSGDAPQSQSFLQMVGSVLTSFFGVQSAKNRERDFVHGKVRAFILVGMLMTVVWYSTFALIVNFILRQ